MERRKDLHAQQTSYVAVVTPANRSIKVKDILSEEDGACTCAVQVVGEQKNLTLRNSSGSIWGSAFHMPINSVIEKAQGNSFCELCVSSQLSMIHTPRKRN